MEKLALAGGEPVEDALHVRFGFGCGLSPPGSDVFGGDDILRSGVPGSFARKLEQEGLAASQFDDGALSFGLHEDSADAAGSIGDRPPLGDEKLEGGVLVGYVLHFVYVEHHHGVPTSNRCPSDFNEEIAEGNIGLGPFGSVYGKRDAGDGHGLDSVEKLADPFLPS